MSDEVFRTFSEIGLLDVAPTEVYNNLVCRATTPNDMVRLYRKLSFYLGKKMATDIINKFLLSYSTQVKKNDS